MKVTVVGQGYVGLPIAVCAAEAGYVVNGFDIDEKKIKTQINFRMKADRIKEQ